jgi:dihydroorotate dehydrogenase electron transfer subunit
LAYHTDVNYLRIVRIKKIKQKGSRIKTLVFDDENCRKAIPGQFVMVWIPGLDEIPMSVFCHSSSNNVSVTVEKVGQATEALSGLKIDDQIGIRGPFGNGFSFMEKGGVLIVGGGTGLIPLVFLGERLTEFPVKMTFLAGAKTKDELLFQDRIKSLTRTTGGRMVVTTDDGSSGLRCMVTEPVERLLAKERFDMIYTCGPEPMMHKMFLLSEQHNLPLQASLERLMRCAVGICGSCMLGGFRVCKDGPVFTREQLRSVEIEFGRFKLDFDGRSVRT